MADPITLEAPGSKSATQRALLLASLAPGTSTLRGALDCDDARALRGALQRLGIDVRTEGTEWTVQGGVYRSPSEPLFCAEAGTCLRFLAAASLLIEDRVTLDAAEQLRRRPVREVVDALRVLGKRVEHLGAEGFAPFVVSQEGPIPGRVRVDASGTSQFLSGLLMLSPLLGGMEVTVTGKIASRAYVELTRTMMVRFGGPAIEDLGTGFRAPAGSYRPTQIQIEADWSSGAMLHVAGWLTGRRVSIPNLDPHSTQGDRRIVDFLHELGRPRPHTFDLSDCPDLITPLAVACAFASQPSVIGDVAHARLKECDRIAAAAKMLAEVGITVEERRDGLRIFPGETLGDDPRTSPPFARLGARIEDFGDHRMAMAAGLLSLRVHGVHTANPECVQKSFPRFWEVLERLRCSIDR
ncbi:MAG: 3-phosphoshikimate 1-carboxyvinyltransferase [Candidatus Eisenbacteria bacterium]|nr:3-phosphoshikimate 1-carboxyvinyltransferase [Candidatus Eisenbacteria bacterium]